jgi:hypothetical protein
VPSAIPITMRIVAASRNKDFGLASIQSGSRSPKCERAREEIERELPQWRAVLFGCAPFNFPHLARSFTAQTEDKQTDQ